MTRPIDSRLVVRGQLCAESPLHVGGMPDDLETDMPLARDGLGRLHVPGTSLAGAFRAWTDRCFLDHKTLLDALWGHQPNPPTASKPAQGRGDQEAKDPGRASRILIEDGPVTLPPGLDEERWDGVGIDRESGAAAQDIKFDRAVLPIGTTIDLRMVVELPVEAQEANQTQALLGHLLAALESGEIRLGAASTRGLGRVRLCLDTLVLEDWSSRDGVLATLRGDLGATLSITQLLDKAQDLVPRRPEHLSIFIHWHPDGPLMTRAGYDGIAVDMLPMVSAAEDGRLAMVLPGSGTKGALRSQAERIVRTVLRLSLPEGTTSGRQRHLKQLDVPLVEHLFGAAKPAGTSKSAGEPKAQAAGRSALTVATTFATGGRASAEHWQGITEAKSDPIEGVPDPAKRPLFEAIASAGLARPDPDEKPGPHLEQATHVAVDRWTGGAAEGLLFSAIEPFGIPWAPIVLTFEPERLPAHLRQPALALLLLTLRDLDAGRIPLGFGVNRGYGSLVVDRIETQIKGGRGDTDSLTWLDRKTFDSQLTLAELDADRMAALQQAWQTWIDDQGGTSD